MKTYNKVINSIDLLSADIIVFLFSFIWLRFYIKNMIVSLLLSIVISLLFLIVIRKIYNKKMSANIKNKSDLEKLKNFSNSLLLTSYEDNLDFFQKIFPESKIQDFYLIATNNTLIIPKLDCLEFSINDLLTILKHKNINQQKAITIITPSVNKACMEYALSLSIKINFLNIQDIYNMNSNMPSSIITITPQKTNTLLTIAKMFIDKKNIKGYILSAIFIIFSSFIVPYKTYYLISASILLILAFISTIQNIKDKTQQKDTI